MRLPLITLIILVALVACVSNSSVTVPENSSSPPAVLLADTSRIHVNLTDQVLRESGIVTSIPAATHTYTLTPYRTPTITSPAPASNPGPLPTGLIGRLGAGHFNQLTVSPNGNRVAVASSVGIYIYRPQGEQVEQGYGDRLPPE